MAEQPINLDEAVLHIDQLLACENLKDAGKLLTRAKRQHFFSEALHDRFGRYYWLKAERATQPGGRDSNFGHSLSYRLMQRGEAGLHWYLSEEDDDTRAKWRDRVNEEFSRDPEGLFMALGFPELPFGRFTHAVVNARLDELRVRLIERGYDDEKLKTLLPKPENPRLRDRIALVGCAVFAFALLTVFIAGVFAIKEWLSSQHPLP